VSTGLPRPADHVIRSVALPSAVMATVLEAELVLVAHEPGQKVSSLGQIIDRCRSVKLETRFACDCTYLGCCRFYEMKG
jgi:hypothetical protein